MIQFLSQKVKQNFPASAVANLAEFEVPEYRASLDGPSCGGDAHPIGCHSSSLCRMYGVTPRPLSSATALPSRRFVLTAAPLVAEVRPPTSAAVAARLVRVEGVQLVLGPHRHYW